MSTSVVSTKKTINTAIYYNLIFGVILFTSWTLLTLNAHQLSHTTDEPAHIAAGLQILDQYQFTYEYQHPPLARAVMALLPKLYGFEYRDGHDIWDSAKSTLYQNDSEQLVFLARLGTSLIFWPILLFYTLLWSRKLFKQPIDLIVCGLVAFLPPVMAHGGLATLDIAAAATMLAALYHTHQLILAPTQKRLLICALMTTIAICTKFSAIPFLGLTYVTWLLFYTWVDKEKVMTILALLKIKMILQLCAVTFITIWACYGFSVASIAETTPGYERKITKAFQDIPALNRHQEIVTTIAQTPLPAALNMFPAGVIHVIHHNKLGHESYLFGEISDKGWRHYYLVTLGVKTPLIFLIMIIAYLAWRIRELSKKREASGADAILLAAIAILGFASIASSINIGIRHILIVYPLLALCIGQLLSFIWNTYDIRSILYVALPSIALYTYTALNNAGNYLSYFNLLAGNNPERIIIKSDLEWGQDLKHLKNEINQRSIEHLFTGIAMMLATDMDQSLGTKITNINFENDAYGWIATSKFWEIKYDINPEKCSSEKYSIGASIHLYYFNENKSLSECLQ